MSEDALPDETTILKFRHLLERQGLTSKMMNVINETLETRGLLLKGGTMVDATIIHAPPSTKYKGLVKNAAQAFSLIGLTNLYLARRKLMV